MVENLKAIMNSGQQTPRARYIPFENYHIAPLSDVTPAALKEAAKLTCTKYRDRELLKQSTALNFLAHKLGFSGGFAGYRQEYSTRLLPFMEQHELRRRCDLINPSTEKGFALILLTPRQVEDGLYYAKRLLPFRLFTGYDVDWYELNNRFFHNNPWKGHPQFKHGCLPYDLVMEEVAKADAESPNRGVQVLEAAIAACDPIIRTGSNLLGDQLMMYRGKAAQEFKLVPRIYKPETMSAQAYHEDEQRCRDGWRLFRYWIERLDRGWVEVLPFNASLVFLKGKHGEYDFLLPGFRDAPFEHNPYEPYLRNADVPKSHDTYHFRRWLYYEYDGWLEQDQHHAEIYYYSRQNTAKDYPRSEDVLKRHLTQNRKYHPPTKTATRAEGFYANQIDGVLLYVSNLISIREFREFISNNREYADYRQELEQVDQRQKNVDRWDTVNSDEDQSLPAAVTWYDANAYAAWVSKTKHLPVRLLTNDEYQKLTSPLIQSTSAPSHEEFNSFEHERLCCYLNPNGTPIEGHPPYMREEDFQRLIVRYVPEHMVWKQLPSGLRFLISHHFGEWLNEEASAVNTRPLSSLCYQEMSPPKGRFAATSTGKYKSKKVGFRLCYIGEPEPLSNSTAEVVTK